MIEDEVPKDFLASVDLTSMQLCPQEHRTRYLDDRHTDVVYSANTVVRIR